MPQRCLRDGVVKGRSLCWLRLLVEGSKIATKMFVGWSCERKISLMVKVV